jgi:hypothetical protein
MSEEIAVRKHRDSSRRRLFAGLAAGGAVAIGGLGWLVDRTPLLMEAVQLGPVCYRALGSIVTSLGHVAATWLGFVLMVAGGVTLSRWRHFPEPEGLRRSIAAFATVLSATGGVLALEATLEVSTSAATVAHHAPKTHPGPAGKDKHKGRKRGGKHRHRTTHRPAGGASTTARPGPAAPATGTPSAAPSAPSTPTGGSSGGGGAGGPGGGGGAGTGGGGAVSGGGAGGGTNGGGGGGAGGNGGAGGGNTLIVEKSNNQEARSGNVEGGGTSGSASNSYQASETYIIG